MTKRALVLGGGGPVGIAWESGLIAGLEASGVRLSDAERIIGTSAGSVVGAQLALGSSGADLEAAQRQQSARAPSRDLGQTQAQPSDTADAPKTERAAKAPGPDMRGFMALMAAKPTDADAELAWRVRVGDYALAASSISEDAFIATFGRIAGAPWPARDFRCTAIDAGTGAFKVWTHADHVSLGAAVASSCAVPGFYPCISIAGTRYYDGGLRSATNADLASDAEVVVLISVMPTSALAPRGASAANPLDAEIAQLRSQGTRVELIVADAASREAFGPNLMDARRRMGALEAGIAQGRQLAEQLRAIW